MMGSIHSIILFVIINHCQKFLDSADCKQMYGMRSFPTRNPISCSKFKGHSQQKVKCVWLEASTKFEAFMAIEIQVQMIWDVMPCSVTTQETLTWKYKTGQTDAHACVHTCMCVNSPVKAGFAFVTKLSTLLEVQSVFYKN